MFSFMICCLPQVVRPLKASLAFRDFLLSNAFNQFPPDLYMQHSSIKHKQHGKPFICVRFWNLETNCLKTPFITEGADRMCLTGLHSHHIGTTTSDIIVWAFSHTSAHSMKMASHSNVFRFHFLFISVSTVRAKFHPLKSSGAVHNVRICTGSTSVSSQVVTNPYPAKMSPGLKNILQETRWKSFNPVRRYGRISVFRVTSSCDLDLWQMT